MKKQQIQVRILFLDCSDAALISRHSENKKLHPLAKDGNNAEAIAREREILAPLRERSSARVYTGKESPKPSFG